jgi:hypothetical protein
MALPRSSHQCVPSRRGPRRSASAAGSPVPQQAARADTGWLMVSDRGFPSKSAMPAAYFIDASRIPCRPDSERAILCDPPGRHPRPSARGARRSGARSEEELQQYLKDCDPSECYDENGEHPAG